MTWKDRTAKIAVGDIVKYSRDFLRSTGQITGPIPFAEGKVESIKDLGGLQIATVAWNTEEAPAKINVKNLIRKGQLEIER